MAIDFNRIKTTPTDTLVDEWMTTASTINPNALLAALEQGQNQPQGLSLGDNLAPQQGLKPEGGLGLKPPPGGLPVNDPLTAAPTPQGNPMALAQGFNLFAQGMTPRGAPPPRSQGPATYGPAPAPAPIPNYFQAQAPTGGRRARSIGDLLGGR